MLPVLRISQSASVSEQIAVSVEQVARGAKSQTVSTEENLQAMEEVAVGAQRIADRASSIADAAVYSRQQRATQVCGADQGVRSDVV